MLDDKSGSEGTETRPPLPIPGRESVDEGKIFGGGEEGFVSGGGGWYTILGT